MFFNKNNSYQGLRPKLIRFIIITYLITSLLALSIVYYILNNKILELGTKFATQYALKEKYRLLSPIEREITLSKKMVDTPLIQEWAQNENDPELRTRALAELESYREHFQDKNYFFVIDESHNYYFNNAKNEYAGKQYRYTLDKNNEKDSWYFTSMKQVNTFILNVNYDRVLKVTSLWIDAIIYNDKGEKIGMAGSGLTLDSFIEKLLDIDSKVITPILFDNNGAIQAYKNQDYISLNSVADTEFDNTIFDLLDFNTNKSELQETLETLINNNSEVATLQARMGNKEKIVAITYIPEIAWYIMILFDPSEILSLGEFTSVISLLILSLLAIVSLIAYFINRNILKPLNLLTNFTDEMSSGNYDKQVKIEQDNELGILARSFNKMASTISEHTHNLEGLVNQRTQELTKTNQKLEIVNKSLMDNISYARYIQYSILPANEAFAKHFREYFIIYQPRDIVGGDFYWQKEVDNKLYLAVVDCTGHGVPGALMTMSANAILNRIIDQGCRPDPAYLLQLLNKNLKDTLYRNNEDLKRDNGLDIALVMINKDIQELTFAGARLSLYINENGDIVRIEGDKQSIGYQRSDQDYQFTNHQVSYGNKTFFITTDGLLDQNGYQDNKRFGRNNFIKLLAENSQKELTSQQEIYKSQFKEFMGQEKQRDDITFLGFRIGKTGQ